jgi:hypothetical protein
MFKISLKFRKLYVTTNENSREIDKAKDYYYYIL